MEGNMQHFKHIMLYYFKKGKMQLKHTKKICAVHADGAVTDRTCQNWFARFHAGDVSLYDAPRSGRPVEVSSDQIEILIENNQCYTMQSVANILKISKSIKSLVKMKHVFYFIEKAIWTFWPTHYVLLIR